MMFTLISENKILKLQSLKGNAYELKRNLKNKKESENASTFPDPCFKTIRIVYNQ